MNNNCAICGDSRFSYLFQRDEKGYFRCDNCLVESISPQLSELEFRCIYDDTYYNGWGSWQAEEVRQAKIATFKNRLNLIPIRLNSKVLDCGCAGGYFLEAAQAVGYVPYGIEINKHAVAIARNKIPADQIHVGELEDSCFPDNSFYAVFMCDFIEHVRNPVQSLKKASYLLSPGGYLVLSTPDAGSISRRLMRENWLHYKTEHLFYFNKKNINLLLKKTGFRVLSIRKAKKCLTLDYIKSHFARHPRGKASLLVKKLVDSLPMRFRLKPMWFSFGEMVVVAKKRN